MLSLSISIYLYSIVVCSHTMTLVIEIPTQETSYIDTKPSHDGYLKNIALWSSVPAIQL
jgi:hypothetical protein